MSPSKILFYFCISFIVGVFFEFLIKIPQVFVWGFLIIASILVLISFLTKKINVVLGFCVLFFIIGILRVQISEFNIANDKLSIFIGRGNVTFTGVVSDEPDVRDKSQKIKIGVGNSVVLVTTDRYPEYNYLDRVKITGKIEAPTVTDTFNYQNYLLKDGIYSVMGFPKIELVSRKHQYNISSYLYEKILYIKQSLGESIRNNFLPPQSSILEGTIVGDSNAMSKELKDKLNITGLRHIISVSGTHVVILSLIVMSILLAMGLWRGQAFYITIIFIFIYVVLTGLPASGIRAGIMGGLYLLAQKIGRQSMGIRVVILACAGMLIFNPLLLLYDVGFQLSFLAVVGLIYLEPFLKLLIRDILRLSKEPQGESVVGIISTTFAAQIFTIPIMIYNFGNISFVSPITNLLILPIVYWLMIFGFLVSVAGIFSATIAWVLAIPCWVLLTYFVGIIDLFSQSWMVWQFTNISWIWLLVAYSAIGFGTWFLNKKYGKEFL